MRIRDIFLVILYLIESASAEHEPKVYEELDEHLPEYTRTARHLDASQKIYQPPIFNYRTAVQQDRLKSRYHRQQQSDSRNLKTAPVNPESIFGMHQYLRQNRNAPKNIPFGQKDNGWKPIQPKFLNPTKPVNQKKKLIESDKQKDVVRGDTHENDLDIASSDPEQQTVKTDRQDQRSQYIYVTPHLLKNSFGLDSKTTQQILQNSAPGSTDSDKFQISELQGLLGKNPSFQLQGLQQLLGQAKPIIENNNSGQKEVSHIQIEHNGSPSLEVLQQQIDAINKAQEEQVLGAAQKQAEAHVKAQHEAIALAQKQAQEEALAKIAAHNQGISTLRPSDQLVDTEAVNHITAAPLISHQTAEVSGPEVTPQPTIEEINQNSLDLQQQGDNIEQPEVSALQERPHDQVLVHPVKEYTGSYAPTAQDLRYVKPRIQGARGRFYRPVSLTRPDTEAPKLEYLSTIPRPLYDPKDVQNYSPVSPYAPHLLSHNDIDASKIISEPTKPSLIHLPSSQEHSQEYQQVLLEPSATNSHQLYTEEQQTQYDDLHQYAAKYAFGYRILDEKHGNDFGHEEERNGKLTKGHYYVRLPDGRKQKVDYYADKSGYHARVSYENVGVHPYHQPRQNEEDEDLLQPVHE